jgi:hypothetical protein
VASSIRIQPGDDGRLALVLPYSPERVEKIKAVPGQRWDPQRKHWTVPNTPWMIARLTSLFAEDSVEVDVALHPDWALIQEILAATQGELTLQRYSPGTHRAYLLHLRRFLGHFGPKVKTLTSDEVRAYSLNLIDTGVSWSSQNQAISTIRLLY